MLFLKWMLTWFDPTVHFSCMLRMFWYRLRTYSSSFFRSSNLLKFHLFGMLFIDWLQHINLNFISCVQIYIQWIFQVNTYIYFLCKYKIDSIRYLQQHTNTNQLLPTNNICAISSKDSQHHNTLLLKIHFHVQVYQGEFCCWMKISLSIIFISILLFYLICRYVGWQTISNIQY